MVASRQSQPLFSSDDTLAVIRSRINEKRLFEAHFLCRKLGHDLIAAQRTAVEQQLAASLKQVEQLRSDAKVLVARGELGPGRELYARIESIAIDVPGVPEEIKALAGAEALEARLSKPVLPVKEITPVVSKGGLPPSAVTVKRTTVRETVSFSSESTRRNLVIPRLYWFAGLAGIVLCLLLGLWVYWGTGGKPQPAEVPPSQSPGVTTATSKEIVSASQPFPPSPSSAPQASIPKETAAKAQPLAKVPVQPEPASPPPPQRPLLNLGGLKVE
ncbi:MAG: hypothetical protein PHI97_14475 [Desulfobulbus sp.]|nr:hypothetical protein [Desulfobulbus sp.]